MKINSLLLLVALVANTPKVIELGEIRIEGDVERPTVSFVIPRAQFDFLDAKGFLNKKNLIQDVTESVKSDIFKVE